MRKNQSPKGSDRARRMERTKRLAVCALLSALGVVVLLLGTVIDVMDLSMAVIASLFCVFAVIEYGGASPWLVFSVTGLLAFLVLPYGTPALFYGCFFGYYPILKEKFERLNRPLSWVCKEAVFHVALVAIVLILRFLLMTPDLMGVSPWLWVAMAIAAELIFILYDIALTRLTRFYLWKLRRYFTKR